MSGVDVTEGGSFIAAVCDGDVSSVRSMIARAPDLVHFRDPSRFGSLALNLAVQRSNREMVDLLLDLGADVDAKSDWWAGGFGALPCEDQEIAEHLVQRGATVNAYIASGMGWLERLERTLDDHPEQLNERYGDGQTPLHVAKSVEVVDLLVSRGIDLEARDIDHGSTALQYLIDKPALCQRLLEHGAEADIFIAAKLGDVDLAHRILDAEPRALGHRIGAEPFNVAGSEGGHIYVYSIGYPWRPLAWAARCGQLPFVDEVLERANPSERLLYFCWQGQRDDAGDLTTKSPDLVSTLAAHDQALIADAAWENRADSVHCMIECGFPIDIKGPEESTPLDRASFHGFSGIVELLLRHGASTDVRNAYGGTPLGACTYGAEHSWRKDGDHVETCRALLKAGARFDPSKVDQVHPRLRPVFAEFADGPR